MFKKLKAFSLVELMISLITISLITAAFAPIITKKLSHGSITLGTFGGGSAEGKTCSDSRYYFENNECVICPEGYRCDGTNKISCMAGTFAAQGQTECAECPDGYYSTNGSSECLENTADNCAEKSKTENACESCSADTVKTVDGKCVGSTPLYSYKNTSGTDVTETATEVTEDDNYWYIKIKSTGYLSFDAVPGNLIDAFVVGGGAGGLSSSTNNCSGAVGGGGAHYYEKNVYITTDKSYKITIGDGGSSTSCNDDVNVSGGTSSAFGLYARGGVYSTAKSVCAFKENCATKEYGNAGTNSNQQANTGNGGIKSAKGMSGVVILRGNKKTPSNISLAKIPNYTYMDTTGSDQTVNNSTLTVSDGYWTIRLTKSGTFSFNSLPSSFIDIFLVGGGSGGRTSSSSNKCSATVGGGGNTTTLENVYVTPSQVYPITIGAGGGVTGCYNNNTAGSDTSGFGMYAQGGIGTSAHSVCEFKNPDCNFNFGNAGANENQNLNTGNGGASRIAGMDGIVILRGKISSGEKANNIPSYKFMDTNGTDTTAKSTALYVTDSYWFLNLNTSGKVLFNSLPSNLVDIFLVGGGSGGRTSSSSNSCRASVGGGGNSLTSYNTYITSGNSYPITIGSGGDVTGCYNAHVDGGTTSGFGLYAHGGVHSSDLPVCAFYETTCAFKYGNAGSGTNQNINTGNGGEKERSGRSGIVIIRGKRTSSDSGLSNKLPVYSYTGTNGAVLTKSDSYWYLKLTATGNLTFEQLPSNTVDVFVVGGGSGGRTSSSGSKCSATVGGGGFSTIQTGIEVNTGETYPVTIGAGGAVTGCYNSNQAGGASSALGVSAAGGTGTTSHSICLFGGSDCSTTYGNSGATGNQNNNTGNGGASEKAGMTGIVIIRGKL